MLTSRKNASYRNGLAEQDAPDTTETVKTLHTHEKVLNIISHHGNKNPNHNEIPLHTARMAVI